MSMPFASCDVLHLLQSGLPARCRPRLRVRSSPSTRPGPALAAWGDTFPRTTELPGGLPINGAGGRGNGCLLGLTGR